MGTPPTVEGARAPRTFRVVAVLTTLLFLAMLVFALAEAALMWLPTQTLVDMFGEEVGSPSEVVAHRTHWFSVGLVAWAVLPAVSTQLRRPAGRQAQVVWVVVAAVTGTVVYGLSGTVGAWVLEEGLVLLPVLALAWLHPRSRDLFGRPARDRTMLGLALMAAVPWAWFALDQARSQWRNAAGDIHAAPEHWATVALLSAVLVAAAVIGASDRPGWQHPAWYAVVASIAWGAHGLAFPEGASSPATAWSALAIAWGLAFAIAIVVRGRTAADTGLADRGPRHPASVAITVLAAVALLAPAMPLRAPAAAAQAPPTRGSQLEDPRWPGVQRLRDEAAVTRVQVVGGFPETVRTRRTMQGSDGVDRALAFIDTYADLYGQDRSPQLALTPTRHGATSGIEYVILQQTIGDVPVLGGELAVLLDGADVISTAGRLLTDHPEVPATPRLSRRDALQTARRLLGAPGAEPTTPPRRVVFSEYVMGLSDEMDVAPALAWQLALATDAGDRMVVIDATTGAQLFGGSYSRSGYGLDLEDANHHDVDNDCYWTSNTDQAAVTEGVYPAYLNDADVVEGWFLSQDIYNTFMHYYGRDSWDDDGDELDVFVHATENGTASWSGGFGCGVFSFSDGAMTRDIFSHEYTHAVIDDEGGLTYANESGAINESFADIYGVLIDQTNWTIGEGVLGTPRDLSAPTVSHVDDPDRVPYTSNPVGGPGGNDNGGVHSNSGIMNHAAYLMAAGDTDADGFPEGIGRAKLRALVYPVMLSLPSTFGQARHGFVSIAEVWAANGAHGFTTSDACAVRNGWALVGVGVGDQDCDGTYDTSDPDADGDFVTDTSDNCPTVPNTLQSDADGDGDGNACDPDADNDGLANGEDNCPLVGNPSQVDSNGDGVGDACEDDDQDGTPDVDDNCPTTYNAAQTDTDGDGEGDACDPDLDGDGVDNDDDNCAETPNPDQVDSDGGGWGDACDVWPNNPLNEWVAAYGDSFADFEVVPGAVEQIRLDLCAAGCPEDWLSLGTRVQVTLSGLPDGVDATLGTRAGGHVATFAPSAGASPSSARVAARSGGARMAMFSAGGLGQYVLRVAVPDDAEPATVDLALGGGVVPDPAMVDRLAGTDRYATAAAIARRTFPLGSETVHLATGQGFADALAGVPGAAVDDAPILLTRPEDLPEATAKELDRLGASHVVVLGGPVAVSEQVVEALRAGGLSVERRWGEDRFATAGRIALDSFPDGVGTAMLATGEVFADALAGGAAAARLDVPVLLTSHDTLPAATRQALIDLGVDDVVVLGGEVAVATGVLDELADQGIATSRLAGRDRYETAAAIVDHAFPPGATTALVATGQAYPDALAGGGGAARLGAPVLLSRAATLPAVTSARMPRGPGAQVLLLGGPVALDPSVEHAVHEVANG